MGQNGYVVGLTGGIGSGKTTVADLFSSLGAALVDTDAIAHRLTASDGRAMAAIGAQMGSQFVAQDGSLDRDATRARAFSDPKVKLALEAILHPLIREDVEAALGSDHVRRAPYAMLIVPLLFEALTYRRRTHATLLVDCAVVTQFARVKHRSGLEESETARIVDSQIPRAVRLQLADYVVWNGDVLGGLPSQIEPLHRRFIQSAREFG
jgi:dephospho-CoA kinase